MNKNKLGKKAVALIIIFMVMFSCGCSSEDDKYADCEEIYVYDAFSYYLYVPNEYAQNTSSVNSNSVLINFSQNAYMSIRVTDYYGKLSKDERNGHSRSDFNLDNECLNKTFNDMSYIGNYADEFIKTIMGYKYITSIGKEPLNGTSYYVVRFNIYDYNEANERGDFRGEGRLYVNVVNGYIYNILLCATSGKLADTPDIEFTLYSFHIGARSSINLKALWIGIGVIILLLILLVISIFIKIDAARDSNDEIDEYDVDEDGVYEEDVAEPASETMVFSTDSTETPDFSEPAGEFSSDDNYKNNNELLYQLDVILGRYGDCIIDSTSSCYNDSVFLDKDGSSNNNIAEDVDISEDQEPLTIMDETEVYSKQENADDYKENEEEIFLIDNSNGNSNDAFDILQSLDVLLGRISDKRKPEEQIVRDRGDDIYKILDNILGRKGK